MEEAVTESIIRQANRAFVQEDTAVVEQQETSDAIINVETFIQAHKDTDKPLVDIKQEGVDEKPLLETQTQDLD